MKKAFLAILCLFTITLFNSCIKKSFDKPILNIDKIETINGVTKLHVSCDNYHDISVLHNIKVEYKPEDNDYGLTRGEKSLNNFPKIIELDKSLNANRNYNIFLSATAGDEDDHASAEIMKKYLVPSEKPEVPCSIPENTIINKSNNTYKTTSIINVKTDPYSENIKIIEAKTYADDFKITIKCLDAINGEYKFDEYLSNNDYGYVELEIERVTSSYSTYYYDYYWVPNDDNRLYIEELEETNQVRFTFCNYAVKEEYSSTSPIYFSGSITVDKSEFED